MKSKNIFLKKIPRALINEVCSYQVCLERYVSAAFAMTITPNSRAFAEEFVPRGITETNDLAILQALYGNDSAWHLSLGTSFIGVK